MHGLRRITSIGLVAVAALAASITPASAATSTTRWVDNDGHAGPNGCGGSATAARKIQKAVDNSNQDDVVIVCPGTYVEQVTITGHRDGLTLKSSTPFGATIKTPSTLDPSLGFPYLLLVDRVDDVTVRGFKTVTRTQAPCANIDVALGALAAKRVNFRGNRVLAPGAATGSCIHLYGIAFQDLSFVHSVSRSMSVTVASNEVRDSAIGAIAAFGVEKQVTATIVGNSIRAYFGEPPAGASALMARRAAGARHTLGVPLPGGPSTIAGVYWAGRIRGSVSDNVIQGAAGAPEGGASFYVGVLLLDNDGAVEVSRNLIRRVGVGIVAESTESVALRSNTVKNSAIGIQLSNVSESVVRRNTVTTKAAGIIALSSTGNAIRDNTFSGNGGVCDDDSTGGGSHGTANTWTGNTATIGDDPNGICPTP